MATVAPVSFSSEEQAVDGRKVCALKATNVASFILCVAFNGLAASGTLTGKAVGEVSDENMTYVTPASFAFSIWSVIYTLLACFVVWQALPARVAGQDEALLFADIGAWFAMSNVCNALWLVVFTLDTVWSMWVSTLVIACLLGSLLRLYTRAQLWQRPDAAMRSLELPFVHIAFSIYGSWVTAATILNASLALSKSGWRGGELAPEAWCVVMVVVALFISGAMVALKRDPVWPAVFCWATVAISRNQWLASAELARRCVQAVAGLAAGLVLVALAARAARGKRAARPPAPQEAA